jgi:hypothetical protein
MGKKKGKKGKKERCQVNIIYKRTTFTPNFFYKGQKKEKQLSLKIKKPKTSNIKTIPIYQPCTKVRRLFLYRSLIHNIFIKINTIAMEFFGTDDIFVIPWQVCFVHWQATVLNPFLVEHIGLS